MKLNKNNCLICNNRLGGSGDNILYCDQFKFRVNHQLLLHIYQQEIIAISIGYDLRTEKSVIVNLDINTQRSYLHFEGKNLMIPKIIEPDFPKLFQFKKQVDKYIKLLLFT